MKGDSKQTKPSRGEDEEENDEEVEDDANDDDDEGTLHSNRRNPYIDDEAEEVHISELGEDGSPPPTQNRRRRSMLQLVHQLHIY